MSDLNKYDYHKLTPFKWFVLQNFPFIEADFDAITNYQLFCKVVEYLNTVIASQNQLGQGVEDFTQEMINAFSEFTTNTNITINDYINKFNQLKDYVENYFENLDVQDEINNKLDDMAEQGTLQEIINTFLQTNCSINFDTVNDMINSTVLQNGSFAKTLGYYSVNDGGGAFYIIKNIHTETDEFIELNNGLFAILTPINNTIYLKQFGAIGDNQTNEHTIIQRFFDYPSKNYVVNNGNYCILSDINLTNSNCNIKFENASIRFLPNASSKYYIINCYNLHDIVFDNIHLIGDKDEHTGQTGEYGHCLNVTDSYNISIKNSIFENAWGDGIYLGLEYNETPLNEVKNLLVDNCRILNSSRNGISVCTGKNITIKNCYIEGTNRTNPMAAIDIEPEHQEIENAYIENLIIDNVIFNRNSYGISVISNSTDITVNISNCKILNSSFGFTVYQLDAPNKSVINVSDLICNGILNSGISLSRISNKGYVNITNPQIYNCNRTGEVTPDLQAGIKINASNYDCYNVNISNPIINSNTKEFGSAIYINASSEHTLYNSNIVNIVSPFRIFAVRLDSSTNLIYDKTTFSTYYDLNYGGTSPLVSRQVTTKVSDFNYSRKLKAGTPNGVYEFEVCDKNSKSYYVNLTDFENVYLNGELQANKRFTLAYSSQSGLLRVRIYNGNAFVTALNGTWENVQ